MKQLAPSLRNTGGEHSHEVAQLAQSASAGLLCTDESVQSFKCTRFLTSWSRSELTRPLATIDHNHSLEMTFFATWLALRATALAELQCLRNLRQNRRPKVSLTRKTALIELWGNNQTKARSSLPFYS